VGARSILKVVRRALSLLVLVLGGACTASLPTADTTSELVGAPEGTTTFPSTQVGDTSAAQTYYMYETTTGTVGLHSDTISSIAYSCPDFTVNWAAGTASDDCILECIGSGSELERPDTDQATLSSTRAGTQAGPDSRGSIKIPICEGGDQIVCTQDSVYSFSATFHPTVAATVSCVLTITSTSQTQTLTLSGTGTAPPIDITASPGSIAFGGVRVSTDSSAVAVTVTNSGGSTGTVSSVAVTSGFAITAGTTTSHTIAANTSETYDVVCEPGTTVGAFAGTLTIANNGPTPTISIPLSCTGTNASLSASPSPAVLPTTRVGEPEQQTITITNVGTASATIQSVTITGVTEVSAPAANSTLAVSGSAQVVVSYPATMAGTVSGSVTVDYDSGSTIDIPIAGQALATSLSLTPDGTVDFGPVCAGSTKSQSFALIANEAGSFKLTALSMPTSPFTLTSPTLPASVAGNAANTVTFGVTAAPSAAGTATSTLQLTTDIPNSQPHAVSLAVIGLPAGVTGTPAKLDAGPAPVKTTTLAQPVNVTNCGDSAITITSATITGPDAASFAIVVPPSSTQIAPATTATWQVVMNSQLPGTLQATFEAVYSGGSVTVALTGEPFLPGGGSGGGPGSDTGPEKSSYYACAVGAPAAVWPLVLALFVVQRRRRRR
jgi:hypothetical protein